MENIDVVVCILPERVLARRVLEFLLGLFSYQRAIVSVRLGAHVLCSICLVNRAVVDRWGRCRRRGPRRGARRVVVVEGLQGMEVAHRLVPARSNLELLRRLLHRQVHDPRRLFLGLLNGHHVLIPSFIRVESLSALFFFDFGLLFLPYNF